MVDNKVIMNILKTGDIMDASITGNTDQYFTAEIKLNSNYTITFYFYRSTRSFDIKKKNNNYYDPIYKGDISEENYIEFDYLIVNRVKEFVAKELEKALVNDDFLPY